MLMSLYAMTLGFCLDLIFGDPHGLPHPVEGIGHLIRGGEKLIRGILPKNFRGELLGGGILAVAVMVLTFSLPYGVLLIGKNIHPLFGFALETVMIYQILATKSLKDESMKVKKALGEGTLEDARKAVSMIVGRDTENLTAEGVTKAAVETVAENTSDGVIAPLIFIALGGGPLGFLYKGINTMDSMIGYKNDKYLYFGRIPAKLDDLANYIPARISACIMIIASLILGMNYKNAYKIYRRDRYNHASPNSAQTEAVCAGALEVELAGNAYYFGKIHEKMTIGDPIRAIVPEDIALANRLLYGTAIITVAILIAIKTAVIFI